MLNTRIKAGQIANLTDARYFAARGVEWLGFNLDEGTENFIHPLNVKAIKEWVEGPKIVGEFGLQSSGEIIAAADLLELDLVQIGHFNDAAPLKAKGISVIQEIILEHTSPDDELTELLESKSGDVELFLLNYAKNQIPWNSLNPEKLKPLFQQFNILLAIDLNVEILSSILTTTSVHGFELKGGEEEKVGLKSFDELDDIFDALESESH